MQQYRRWLDYFAAKLAHFISLVEDSKRLPLSYGYISWSKEEALTRMWSHVSFWIFFTYHIMRATNLHYHNHFDRPHHRNSSTALFYLLRAFRHSRKLQGYHDATSAIDLVSLLVVLHTLSDRYYNSHSSDNTRHHWTPNLPSFQPSNHTLWSYLFLF